MKLPERFSLRIKTIAIAMSTSLVVLVITGLFFSIYSYRAAQQTAEQELEVIARIVADRSTAALEFFDAELASANLSALSARTTINLGCLYNANQELFASYSRPSYHRFTCPMTLNEARTGVQDGLLLTEARVILDETIIGYLLILTDESDLRERAFLQLITGILIMSLTAVLAFLMSVRLQRFVTAPLAKLQDTVVRIQQSDNYSLRATKITNDELGDLVDAFNGMVAKIESDNISLRNNEERFRTLTGASPVGVFQTDEDGQFIYVNARWREITGIYDLHLTNDALAQIIHPEDRYQTVCRWREALAQGEELQIEYRLLRDDGAIIHVICHAKPLRDTESRLTGFLGSLSDISELKSVQTQLEQLALYDPLTSLANRHLMRNRLEKAIRQSRRSGLELAVLFLDIDHFKKVNDTLGHDQGDELLKTIAHRLRYCTRPGDTAARMGGDEFTVLIPELQSRSDLEIIVRKILDTLKAPVQLTGHEMAVSTSIGVAIGPSDADDAATLLKHADMAMYRAKAQGRDNYQYFSQEMNLELTRQLTLETELRAALLNDEFQLHYQPLHCLRTGNLTGYEALLRWQREGSPLRTPDQFIPVAEDTGLILPIGEWVITTACAQLRELSQHNLLSADNYVSINLSARQFRDPDLLQHFQAALKSTNINASQLQVEITESLLMERIESNMTTLEALRQLGVRVAIDDFGTGYSSLCYLKQLPIDVLKIDKSFIMNLEQEDNDREITAAIIAMAHKLNLSVVAEGVETLHQQAYLKANQCDVAQGYLYGKPQPLSQLLNPTSENPATENANT